MFKKLILSILITLNFCRCIAQGALVYDYSTSGINDSLKTDAHAVYRLDEALLEINSPAHFKQTVHQIITILDEEGAGHLYKSIAFDKFTKVNNIDIRLYNKSGIELKRFRKSDFETRSYLDGSTLASDDKIMRLHIAYNVFPCTVEMSYTIEASGYIELPDWIISNQSESTEDFRYTVVVPNSIDIRYRSRNMDLKPVIQTDDKNKTYSWEVKNVKACKISPNGFKTSKYLPRIEVAPNFFEYDGYKGSFSAWNDFGKWNYPFYEDKPALSQERITEIKALIPPNSTNRDKINILYSYLKHNMRYVSIQLGIGGFKPFPAKFVDENKYGDCKALTNYMRNLLSIVGIKSYPALITSGYNSVPADPSFPSDVFDHVILCIPQEKDSVWLECTSNSKPAGFLGSFTENKYALLLKEDGGVLVQTPKSNYKNNQLNSKTEIELEADGGAIVENNVSATGDIDDFLNEVSKEDNDRQKEIYVHYFNYKDPEEFSVKGSEQANTSSVYKFQLNYDKIYDFKTGNKYFLPQSIYKLSNEKLSTSYSRTNEYLFEYPYDKTDTTIFHLPENFKIENTPSPIEVNNDLGYYKKQVVINNEARTITVIAHLILKNNIISAMDYKKIAEFFATVQKDEDQKIVVQNNGNAVVQN